MGHNIPAPTCLGSADGLNNIIERATLGSAAQRLIFVTLLAWLWLMSILTGSNIPVPIYLSSADGPHNIIEQAIVGTGSEQ